MECDDGTTLRANKEVILAGGSINTPQLLLLSGIGPRDELEEHGIDVVHHLPGVGKNLQDHMCINMAVECTDGAVTLDHLSNPFHKAKAGAEWLLGVDDAVAASNVWEVRANQLSADVVLT